MFELWLKATEEAGELTLVPVSRPQVEVDDDSPYSARMCPQPVELILEGMNECLPPEPKRKKRRCVKKRLPLPCFIIRATSRPREHRAAPRRDGGARADSSGDGPGGGDPPPHPKSEHGPGAEANPPQSVLRAGRVLERRARP